MRLIEFLLLAGQLYSSGALFLRKEAPRSCTTHEGEAGECVLHDQCDNDSTIIRDGTGIINPRSLQSTDCPLSKVCCKIPDKHLKDSDHSGEQHQPIKSGEPHRNQLITSRQDKTNHPQTSYSVELDRKLPKSWPCTTIDGSRGECVQNYQCDMKTNSVINNGDGIIDVRIDESTDCPLPTVCCKIPDNPQTPNSEVNYQNQPKTSDQETMNHPQKWAQGTMNHPQKWEQGTMNHPQKWAQGTMNHPQKWAQGTMNHPHTVSCTSIDGSPGECVQNYLCDMKTNSVINNGNGIIDVRIDESTDCPLPTVCCKIPDNRRKDSDPQTPNSEVNYQNQPKTSDQETMNHPQKWAQGTMNHPQKWEQGTMNHPQKWAQGTMNHPQKWAQGTMNHPQKWVQGTMNHPHTVSCTTIDGSPGECVQNYLCDMKTNSVINNGNGIIDVRIDESTDCPLPTVCCKIPDNRRKDSDPQTLNSEVNYQNQPKTSDQETMNHPQKWAQGTMNHPQKWEQGTMNHPQKWAQGTINHSQKWAQGTMNHPHTVSCTTIDGSPGECVQNYLCDMKTNSVINNGNGIIDVRIDESTDCPLPTVCCKIPDNRRKDSDPQMPNSEENYQNQEKTSHQETMNRPQTLAQKPTNHPQTLSCTTIDGSPGECVQNYLCDIDTNSAITNGDGIIDVRIDESTDCPLSTVCCKIPDNRRKDSDPQTPNSEENYQNQAKTTHQETTNRPQTLAQKPTNHPQTLSCTTIDGSPGECVQNYLCDIDTNSAITNGDGIIDVRINESTNCPLPTVCCKILNNNQEDPSHSKELDRNQQKTLDQEIMNYPRTSDQEIINNPQTLSCTTMDGTPGECVQNYLCDIETSTSVEEKNSASINGCPIPMVCCKLPDISSRSNLPSQSALYPTSHRQYIRVPRDMNRSGCGHRNHDGVNVTGVAFDTAPEYAKPGEFPWTVAVVNLKGRVDKIAQFDYLGSGALIHERAVLTAAHIFHGASTRTTFYVVIGDYNQKAVDILPRKAIGVQNVEIHNLYDKNLFYDIALVFLQKPVLVSGHVNYICLPPLDYQDPVGTRCISSGWGKNGFDEHQYIMNKAELPVVEHTACESLLRRVDELGPVFELHSSFMCAGEGRVDSCKGSGGAPLACPMQNEPDRYVLSGVVSWSNNCSLDGIPSVYARVPTVRQWIDDKMAANGYPITSK